MGESIPVIALSGDWLDVPYVPGSFAVSRPRPGPTPTVDTRWSLSSRRAKRGPGGRYDRR
jgi:hypothetical protein